LSRVEIVALPTELAQELRHTADDSFVLKINDKAMNYTKMILIEKEHKCAFPPSLPDIQISIS
jgi:hypothetical protein